LACGVAATFFGSPPPKAAGEKGRARKSRRAVIRLAFGMSFAPFVVIAEIVCRSVRREPS
jgi:hypothetical protein